MAKAEYRSSLRSKKLITDALGELLDEKTLDKITVTDIVKKANINRGTFYAHYDNVNDVVTSIFQSGYKIITNSVHDLYKNNDFDMGVMLKQLQSALEQDFAFYTSFYAGGIIKLYRDWFIGNLPMTFDELTARCSVLLEDMKHNIAK